jgi:hypothetical protein
VDRKRRKVQYVIDLAGAVPAGVRNCVKAVSVVFQDVVVFVLYLPTGAAALRKQGGILFGYRFIGDPTFRLYMPEPPTGGEA